MDFKYIHFKTIPNTHILNGILQLHNGIFGDSDKLVNQMKSKSELHINVAMEGEKVIGYKIGYKLDDAKFYSWLGGIDKNYRRYGVATKLMEEQHQYLREVGFTRVQTKTKNKWRKMLILNIKSGFDIIGTYTDEERFFFTN